MDQATQVAISFDFEIGWGVWETGRWRDRERRGVYRDLRSALSTFVTFLGERNIAVTWATVGAMIRQVSDRDFEHLPSSAQRAISEFRSSSEEQTQNGADLLETILRCECPQTFASHSFSHTRFNFDGLTHEARVTDLRLSKDAMAAAGVPVTSLVFPENIVTDWAALSEAGFKVGRLPPVSSALGGALGRLATATVTPPPLSVTKPMAGPVAGVSGSMFFNWYGRSAPIRRQIVRLQARRGLQKILKDGGTLHLWLHPFNLVDSPHLAEDLCKFLDLCAAKRDQGRLQFVGL